MRKMANSEIDNLEISNCNLEGYCCSDIYGKKENDEYTFTDIRTLVNFEEYKKILSGFTIKSSFIDYHCYENIYYSPSSFSVIEEIYTVNEAAEKWGMSEGTLRNAIKTDKFIEKVEWRKAGRITLISEKAMKRVYGEPKANNN